MEGDRATLARAASLPPGKSDPGHHWHAVLRAHAPGPRGPRRCCSAPPQGGRPGAQQLPLRHHARQPRRYMGVEAVDLVDPRGPAARAGLPFRATSTWRAWKPCSKEQGPPHPLRHDHGDQQHRRRPAGFDGNIRAYAACSKIRQNLHHGRVPLLRETPCSSRCASRRYEHADQDIVRKCSPTPTAPP